MDARQDIAYLLILLMLVSAVALLFRFRRSKRRDRRSASQPIRLLDENREES